MAFSESSPVPESHEVSLADDLPVPIMGLEVEEFRRLGYRAVDLAADYLASLRNRPVFLPMSPNERQALLEIARRIGDRCVEEQV